MEQKPAFTRRRAELLLAAVIIARSTSYLMSKLALESLGPFTLLALRSLAAFLLLALLFHRRLRSTRPGVLVRGALLGGAFFLLMTAELFGLRRVESSTASMLENTAIVLVPLLDAALCRRLPRPAALVSAGVTLLGIGLLVTRSGSLSWQGGEPLCLLFRRHFADGSALPADGSPAAGHLAGGLHGTVCPGGRTGC